MKIYKASIILCALGYSFCFIAGRFEEIEGEHDENRSCSFAYRNRTFASAAFANAGAR
jgi:hypothetical protein